MARFAAAVLVAVDVPAGDAHLFAEALVDAELRGVASHGLQFLPFYVGWIRQDRINPRATLTRPMDAGPTATIDGDRGLGQVVATAAADLAIEKALEHGVGTVVARRCGHTGALAYYAARAAAQGCIGLVISQGGNAMAPTGGVAKLVGNNPLAYAFPTRRGFPLVLDMAVSAVAAAKVLRYQQHGWPLPDGWVRDAAGRPTNDPRVLTATMFSPEGGTLVPLGEHKGYGLALAHDILAGVLSGGRFGRGLGAPGFSVFVQALRIDRFLPLEDYFDRLDQLIDQLKGSELAPGAAGIVVPGERAHATKAAHLAEGVPLDPGALSALEKLAHELGQQPLTPIGATAA
jgi:LDH2 family malate/lactate/ureidoglycolate dehydrogenase